MNLPTASGHGESEILTDHQLSTVSRPGDLNLDEVTNGADLAILLASWGAAPTPIPMISDLNRNGAIDGADLAALIAAWGADTR